MVLELHIWGPAFGLPSIDAQCLAAIAYLYQTLPQGEWVLIASSDPNICPENELPALRNGSTWVSKFTNIVDYLRQYSAGQWDLDEGLDQKQRADSIAYASFLESRGQPLLDLSLYVSSENYTSLTRGAYADILKWPNQWITPPNIREVSRKRSEHLGLSSLDVDLAASQDAPQAAEGASKSLFTKQKETVTSLLGRPTHKNQFKLEALTDDVYEPLQELLGEKHYFLSQNQTSSLDCIILGYLSLMLYPGLPHPWTNDFMQSRYSKLAVFTKRLAKRCYGPPIQIQQALCEPEAATSKTASKLPWQAPQKPTYSAMGKNVLTSVTDSLPFVGQLRSDRQLRKAASDFEDTANADKLKDFAQARSRETYSQIASVATVLGLFASYLFYEGIIEWPFGREEEERRPDLGEAGEFLGAL